MRRFIFSCIGLLLMALLLGACAAPASGPRTWLDRPLDHAKLPLAPITIQAHASAADGVGSFEPDARTALKYIRRRTAHSSGWDTPEKPASEQGS